MVVLGIDYRVRILVAIIIRAVMVLAELRLCLQTGQRVGGDEEEWQ